MDLEARVKQLEEKIEFLMAMMNAQSELKKMNIDINKFPTKTKSFKN